MNHELNNTKEEKLAIIGIFIYDFQAASQVNELLHEYGSCIVGRMGIPFKQKGVNIISIIVCTDNGTISALSGKLGRIKGIRTKAMQTDIYETGK